MKLVNEDEFKKIISGLKIEERLQVVRLLIQLLVFHNWEIMLVLLERLAMIILE